MTGAADRLPRLLALVPYLRTHPGTDVNDVAAVFGVDVRQLRDDLNLLWVCGLWLFHALVHAELRYNFPVMPMLFLLATTAAVNSV